MLQAECKTHHAVIRHDYFKPLHLPRRFSMFCTWVRLLKIMMLEPCMLLPTVIRRTGRPDKHLGKSLLVIVSQVKVIKRGKHCLVTPLCQQMLQLLTDGGFPRALRSAHPNKQRSVWMRLLMLLQLLVEPEIDRQVVLVDTSSANRHHSRWLSCAKVMSGPLLTSAGRWLCYQ